MTSPNERDEFERMTLHRDIARAREIIEQYEVGMTFYRTEIETKQYRLGRLDERWGGGHDGGS